METVNMASDCLGVALGFYVSDGKDLPTPTPMKSGEVLISVPPLVASKLAVYCAMREQRMTRSDLAERLNLDDEQVRRLLDPRYRTHMTTVQRALSALGRSLVVEDHALASPPETVAID